MTTAVRPAAAARPGRPGAGRLALEQVGYTLRDLWRVRVVAVFTFLFPLTWLLLYGVLAGNDAVDADSGVRVMQFATPSAAVLGLLYATLPTVASSLGLAREQGILKRVRGTPLPGGCYVAGRIGGAAVFAIGAVTAMLLVGVLAYDVRILGRTLVATVVTLVVAIACFAALGLAVAMLAPSAAVAQAGSIGAAVVLAMISGVMFVGDLPAGLDRVAGVLPLRPLHEALQDQFNPFVSGSGWDLGALAIMAGWGIAGAGLAAQAFRWDPPARRGRSHPAEDDVPVAPVPAGRTGPVPVATPGRPGDARLLLAQAAWGMRAAWRDPGTLFFAVAFPVALFVLIAQSVPVDAVDGVPFVLVTAAGMIAWGVAVVGFVNAAESVARARDRGVLKRLRGTPLHPALYLAGQGLAALWTGLVVAALVLLVGVAFLGLRVSWAGLLPAAVVLLLGGAAVTACGFAVASVVPSSKAVVAVGLGVLLPVAFVSDVFYTGDTAPAWMDTVGSVLPLQHLVHGLVSTLNPGGAVVDWAGIAVMGVWLLGAGLVAARGFAWRDVSHRAAPATDVPARSPVGRSAA